MDAIDPRLFGPGVYHLLEGEEVVYIGCSYCLAQRIKSWSPFIGTGQPMRNGRREGHPDGIRVVYADTHEQAIELEKEHLAKYRPRMNRSGVDVAYVSPGAHWSERAGPQPTFAVWVDHYGPGREQTGYFTRRSYIESVREVSMTQVRKLDLGVDLTGITAIDALPLLESLGFPPPDYAGRPHKGTPMPRWHVSTVLAWLDAQTFDDEKEAA